MIIHCDQCGAEIDKESACEYEVGAGELFFFCNEVCLEKSGHLTPVEGHDPEDTTIGSSVDLQDDSSSG